MSWRRSLVPILAGAVLAVRPAPAAAEEPAAPATGAVAPAPVRAAEPHLSPGSHPVSIMDLQPPRRAGELFAVWMRALKEDPEWFASYSRAHSRPGEPLPYHPKMGLSETDYREMLELSRQIRMIRVARATLTITREGTSRIALHGGTALPGLTGVTLDLEADRVTTPFGRMQGSTPIEVTDPQSPTGPWSGRSWRLDTLDPTTGQGTVAQLHLGRLADGTPLLYYDAKRLVKGAVQARAFHLVTFD